MGVDTFRLELFVCLQGIDVQMAAILAYFGYFRVQPGFWHVVA